jgi:putative aminopeptidase FrvX
MKELFQVYQQLVAVVGPSGREGTRAALIAEMIRPYVDKLHYDSLGNLIAHKRGDGPRIMVAAHMDTLGFIVERIDDQGYLKAFAVGGISAYALSGKRIRFAGGSKGAFQAEQRADISNKSLSDIKISDFYIDIGARGRAEAETMVRVGERGVYDVEPELINDHIVLGPYCDDLIGCAAVIKALSRESERKNDLYYVFTAQEEVGCRGARAATERIKPDLALVVEAVGSEERLIDLADQPQIVLGGGPVLREYDGRTIYDHFLFQAMKKLIIDSGKNCQVKCSAEGANDSAAIQLSRCGVRVACISIPTRYLHSQAEMQDLRDANAVADIVAALSRAEFASLVSPAGGYDISLTN